MTTPYALIFGPADVSHMMRDMQHLYSTHSKVRSRFEEVANSADIDVNLILRNTPISAPFSCMQIVSLGLLAGMLGMADDVIEQRGSPCCVGGISLGELAALCISGTMKLDDVISLIQLRVDMPADDDEEEAVGFAMTMQEGDREFYHQPPEMRISVNYGLIQKGIGSFFMVSGLRRTLEGLGQEGPSMLEVLPDSLCKSAHHTPYRQWIASQIEDYLTRCELCIPAYPIVTCLEGLNVVKDQQGAKNMIIRSETEALSVPYMIQQMQDFNVADAICIGPFLRSLNMDLGVPVSFRDEKWVDDTYRCP